MFRTPRFMLFPAIILLLGCGGDSATTSGTDDPPTISTIADQNTEVDTPLGVPVTIADEDPSSVAMSASSDNSTLIDAGGLAFTGTGTARTLTLTPKAGESGLATITVTATDAADQTDSGAFDFTVEEDSPAGPFTWSELLLASDGHESSDFGQKVCISGDLIAVGTRDVFDNGSAYIFKSDSRAVTETWSVSKVGSFFGVNVALDGDYLAVGNFTGPTYLYSRDSAAADSWTEEGSLVRGGNLSLSGERVLLGNTINGCFLYLRDEGNWGDGVELNPGGIDVDDEYGVAVALDGDVAVIGARGDDDLAVDAGAVYVFRFNGVWTLEQKLTAAEGLANDRFGHSVAVEGDLIVVGAPYESGLGSGAAYVFTRDGGAWGQTTRIAYGSSGDLFGTSVDIGGGEILVGALSGGNSGAVYHYTGSGADWSIGAMHAIGDNEHDGVGASVAIDGAIAVVGAPGDDDQGSSSGSVHVFVR